jgi:hypothetical protein
MVRKRPPKIKTKRKVPSVDDFFERFATAWKRRAETVIACGQIYIEAKEALPHGEFGKFTDLLQEKLRVSTRIAQMLMKIARNPVLSKTKFFSFLPGSYVTLHALTALPDDLLEQMIADGSINSGTSRARVEELKEEAEREEAAKDYWHRDMREAFEAITAAMIRDTSADEIINAAVAGRWANGKNLLKAMPQIAAWLAKIAERCEVLAQDQAYTKDQAEQQKWRDAFKPKRKKKISSAELSRREQCRERMIRVNESR